MKKLILCLCFTVLAPIYLFAQYVILTPSDYNGYNISCYGGRNGSITANVSGGTPPYTYRWSTGATTASINNLREGYYVVEVNDADSLTPIVEVDITLNEPDELSLELTPYVYPNQRNISCYGCSNGSITTTIVGGVTPYTFNWIPSNVTMQNPNNLGAGENTLNVVDANNCTVQRVRNLSQPERSDWTMTGNSGTNASTNFLGTTDNVDFVFKTNSSERLRLKGNGELKIAGFADNTVQLLYADSSGNIKKVNPALIQTPVPWFIKGNSNINEATDFIGPNNNQDFIFKTGSLAGFSFKERMRITKDGKICLLSDDAQEQLQLIKVAQGNPSDAHPERRGIVIDNDPGGLFNFYIHNYKTNASFNFRVTDGSSNTTSALMTLTKDKKVGIGTDNPGYFLDFTSSNPEMYLTTLLGSSAIPNINLKNAAGFWHISGPRGETGNPLSIYWNANTRVMSLTEQGTVLINVNPSSLAGNWQNYKLLIDGNVWAEEVRVKLNSWPDYVFTSDYKLKSLDEVEQFINNNNHLPGFDSAKQIEQDGQNLGQLQILQQEKLEELYLHVIALEKRVKELEIENNGLKNVK